MPAKSKAQQRLMAAAEHGATFPMAQKVRSSMTLGQLHDFAVGSMKGKPVHVPPAPSKPTLSRASGLHPHRNLGAYLHPKKGR